MQIEMLGRKQQLIHELALRLVEQARWAGVVLTIETKPLAPLAMGNYEMVVETRMTKEANARGQS